MIEQQNSDEFANHETFLKKQIHNFQKFIPIDFSVFVLVCVRRPPLPPPVLLRAAVAAEAA